MASNPLFISYAISRIALQPKNCFMNCLRTYISQIRICPKKKEANEIKCSPNNYLGF